MNVSGYNHVMLNQIRSQFCMWVVLLLALSACNPATSLPTVTSTAGGQLTPYHSPTPSQTPVLLTMPATIQVTPQPTATPFTHTVVKGETMLGIALKYSVKLEDLKAANPNVDPGFLVIGSTLIIPMEGQIPETAPTSTPIPVKWQQPWCYTTSDGGQWCFLEVVNDQAMSLENLSAWIGLFNTQGENIASGVAVSPLNILYPGESMPLMVFFAPSLPTGLRAQGELLTSLAVSAGDPRYMPVKVDVTHTTLNNVKTQTTVSGQVLILQGQAPSLVWLTAVAYDGEGKVVGVRKWEAVAPCGSPVTAQSTMTSVPTAMPGTATAAPSVTSTQAPWMVCIPFDLTVYSLGPAVKRVEVLAEARP